MTNLLITNGEIIDGTGRESFIGHVQIKDDKIESVVRANTSEANQLLQGRATDIIDVKGLALAPGFIDCHTHFDWIFPLPHHPNILFPMIEQGVTTVISGNCGFSPFPVTNSTQALVNKTARFLLETPLSFRWTGADSYFANLENSNGLLFNNAQLIGHGTTQTVVTGSQKKQPSNSQMDKMVHLTKEAFNQGAYGLSLGLMYPPGIFSTAKDLRSLAQVTAEYGRVLTVHIKALSKYSGSYPIIPFLGRPHNLKAIDEILSLGLETGVKLQISHLMFAGTKSWPTGNKVVKRIEKAIDSGLEVMFDVYPVFCGNSYLSVFLPGWFMQDRKRNLEDPKAIKKLKSELKLAMFLLGFNTSSIQIMKANYDEGEKYNGLNLDDIAKKEGLDPVDTMLMMIKKSEGQTLQMTYGYSGDDDNEWLIEKLMAHPRCLFETDTLLLSRGFPNPASYGAFPRILGHFVRNKKALSLVDAVHRMTGKTAHWFGLKNRGEIKPGNFADITVFSPDTIADNTTIKKTNNKPIGIEKVFVNGQIAVTDGHYLKGKKPGSVLRYGYESS